MKEKLYTIPVNDAFDKDYECPICAMYEELENRYVEYAMGPSYMEDDIRDETDRLGFCEKHMKAVFEQKNALGLALVLQTHLRRTRKEIEKLSGDLGKPASLMKKAVPPSAAAYVNKLHDTCFVCKRIAEMFDRYLETVFYLYKKDPAFRQKFAGSKGFCTDHYGVLIVKAGEQLKGAEYEAFIKETTALYLKNLERVEEDLAWFVNKFDYRYANEPWKNAKDAVPRAMLKANGIPYEPLS